MLSLVEKAAYRQPVNTTNLSVWMLSRKSRYHLREYRHNGCPYHLAFGTGTGFTRSVSLDSSWSDEITLVIQRERPGGLGVASLPG